MHAIRLDVSFLTAALVLLLSCSTPKPEPQIASSAQEATYAEAWPAELDDLSTQFASRQQSARKLFSQFFLYPTKLKDPREFVSRELLFASSLRT